MPNSQGSVHSKYDFRLSQFIWTMKETKRKCVVSSSRKNSPDPFPRALFCIKNGFSSKDFATQESALPQLNLRPTRRNHNFFLTLPQTLSFFFWFLLLSLKYSRNGSQSKRDARNLKPTSLRRPFSQFQPNDACEQRIPSSLHTLLRQNSGHKKQIDHFSRNDIIQTRPEEPGVLQSG